MCPASICRLNIKAGHEFAERQFPAQLERLRRNKLRSLGDICMVTIALNYANAQGLLQYFPHREIMVHLSRDIPKLRDDLEQSMNYSVVCINDSIAGDDQVEVEIENLLADYFKKRMLFS